MKLDDRAQQLLRYSSGYAAVLEAFAALSEAGALDFAPASEWSARQVIHHLADTELVRGYRLRLLLAAEAPFLQGYDEKAFADRLHYERPIEASRSLFRAATDSNLELIALASETDWLRTGTHEELGAFSLEAWLERAAWHLNDHADQLRRLRERHDA